uniref:Thiol:disulfide interchange protein n=1 Tax=Polysiphonia scopulorum TaxID=257860 RepID=A0A1Z1MHS6_9FLOR|nr:thiol:disulfide interchange protein [Polysiphonia scopulorum]ARW65516.1 thiol:disulfide interchange protein [Polysiphonia scopulorum]
MFNLFFFNIFDSYAVVIYSLQQYLAQVVLLSHDYNRTISYVIFFSLGFVTIFTPCFFSILPLLFLYINVPKSHDKSLLYCILGLLTSFCLLIFSTHSFSSSFIFRQLPIFSYLVLIILSLDFMKILNFSSFYLNLLSLVNSTPRQTFSISSYFIGFVIGLSSLPCSTPVLLLVNLLLFSYTNMLFVMISVLFYLLGFIISFLIIFNLKFLHPKVFSFSFMWDYFISVSGSILFIISCSSFLKVLFI